MIAAGTEEVMPLLRYVPVSCIDPTILSTFQQLGSSSSQRPLLTAIFRSIQFVKVFEDWFIVHHNFRKQKERQGKVYMVPAVVRNHVWAAPVIPSLLPKFSAGFARGTSLPRVGNSFLRVGQMTRPANNLCLPEHCSLVAHGERHNSCIFSFTGWKISPVKPFVKIILQPQVTCCPCCICPSHSLPPCNRIPSILERKPCCGLFPSPPATFVASGLYLTMEWPSTPRALW